MDNSPSSSGTLIEPHPSRLLTVPEAAREGDFSVYRETKKGFIRIAAPWGALVLAITTLAGAVWDVAGYSHDQHDMRDRIVSLEAAYKVQASTLDAAQRLIAAETDRGLNIQSHMAALETSLAQANAMLQKLSESNARLEERVIFLMAQVEGRMSQGGGRKP